MRQGRSAQRVGVGHLVGGVAVVGGDDQQAAGPRLGEAEPVERASNGGGRQALARGVDGPGAGPAACPGPPPGGWPKFRGHARRDPGHATDIPPRVWHNSAAARIPPP